MGSCITGKRRRSEPIAIVYQRQVRDTPVVFIEENFKIVDYTQTIKDLKDFNDIKMYFNDYKPTDIRCVRGKNEDKQDHSHVIISFSRVAQNQVRREIGLITDYSPYGFAISIGEMSEIKEICNLSSSSLELLHLPKTDNQDKVTVADVIEWAYEHKDERYMNPKKTPEFNMGRRIFKNISGILAEKKKSSRI
jgi:hypothetical protein